ncbi:hypothetical protein EDC04DRAFT_2615957 [Pisolithus marmoratus]|nr:hypothetical protein EDC04DRAFT_2615957 [Pisolithus marmoratus]
MFHSREAAVLTGGRVTVVLSSPFYVAGSFRSQDGVQGHLETIMVAQCFFDTVQVAELVASCAIIPITSPIPRDEYLRPFGAHLRADGGRMVTLCIWVPSRVEEGVGCLLEAVQAVQMVLLFSPLPDPAPPLGTFHGSTVSIDSMTLYIIMPTTKCEADDKELLSVCNVNGLQSYSSSLYLSTFYAQELGTWCTCTAMDFVV